MTGRPRRAVLSALVAVVVLGAGATAVALTREETEVRAEVSGGQGSGAPVPDRSRVETALAALPERELARLDTSRLAEGLVPPTNRWFSSLALGPAALPVFPVPLGYGPRPDGFSLGVPRVVGSQDAVVGGAPVDVTVRVAGTTGAVVVAHDNLTVTLELRDATGAALARLVLAQGSPSVTLTATTAVRVDAGLGAEGTLSGRSWATTITGGERDGASVRLGAGGTLTWLAAPDGVDAATLLDRVRPVTAGRATGSVAGERASTTLTWDGTGSADGLVAVMPHQRAGLASGTRCDLGTYPSAHGTLHLCAARSITWSVPARAAPDRFDLSALTGAEREEIAAAVRADVASTPEPPVDTYGGGKALQRSLQLLLLAEDLDLDEEARTVRAALVARLDRWLDPVGCHDREAECFVWDPVAHTVVGLEPSFGSDEVNDHHFHWGYLLRTAGTLAADDAALAARWGPVLDVLSADIAGSGLAPLLPETRVYDAYAGHSWASGTSPFADGNNQESTSEAVNAWQGVRRWGLASGQPALAERGTWLAANEQDSALRYGLAPDLDDPALAGFGSEVFSLTWGNKRDHATWFSADPAAMLGILVIPMPPDAQAYLAHDPARVRAAVAEATTGGTGFARPLGDQVLAYSALGGADARREALAAARSLDARWVDSGSSRAQLLAWVMTAPRS